MAGKPSKQDILENYSFREILDILERKLLMMLKGCDSIRTISRFQESRRGGNVPRSESESS